VGRSGTVVERIANDEHCGTVRIEGEVWTARALDDDHVIDPGTKVQVVEIRGATAVVIP
jgi:membrane protein implicated in regulation of membrane protease activity